MILSLAITLAVGLFLDQAAASAGVQHLSIRKVPVDYQAMKAAPLGRRNLWDLPSDSHQEEHKEQGSYAPESQNDQSGIYGVDPKKNSFIPDILKYDNPLSSIATQSHDPIKEHISNIPKHDNVLSSIANHSNDPIKEHISNIPKDDNLLSSIATNSYDPIKKHISSHINSSDPSYSDKNSYKKKIESTDNKNTEANKYVGEVKNDKKQQEYGYDKKVPPKDPVSYDPSKNSKSNTGSYNKVGVPSHVEHEAISAPTETQNSDPGKDTSNSGSYGEKKEEGGSSYSDGKIQDNNESKYATEDQYGKNNEDYGR